MVNGRIRTQFIDLVSVHYGRLCQNRRPKLSLLSFWRILTPKIFMVLVPGDGNAIVAKLKHKQIETIAENILDQTLCSKIDSAQKYSKVVTATTRGT